MFERILIANRGEIACRVIRTCKRMGIATVAIYSEADSGAQHVRLADEAVCVGPARAADSYLNTARIVDAIGKTGAQAVHPGYGFLSENAAFARTLAQAGIGFIGPRPATIDAMGSKIEAKALMERAGVRCVPGYHGDDQDPEALRGHAVEVGFPLLIKASAGGGGKGMRIVRAADEFDAALAGAKREATNAFGDDRVLLERFVDGPRHIEFQVFGDTQGNIVHLYERECSIQRRYQKIVEETPSPFLDPAMRETMGEAAVAAARAVDYVNAGTVEFIVSGQREFYFMEMNTRLQVEHPVTELCTGLDLVEWQLRVAAGEALPLAQNAIRQTGHAIEARIYAENPDNEFMPSVGHVSALAVPGDDYVRVDSGIVAGDTISIHYDPMIAKLCVSGPHRASALGRLRRALARTFIAGPVTNLKLLRRIAAHPEFASGNIDTRYIDRHLGDLVSAVSPPPAHVLYAAAAAILLEREAQFRELPGASPWDRADGWQAGGLARNRLVLADASGEPTHLYAFGWHGSYRLVNGERDCAVHATSVDDGGLTVVVDGHARRYRVFRSAAAILVACGDEAWGLELRDAYPVAETSSDDDAHPGAPMPGRIVAINIAVGDRVRLGEALLVMEGMKMEFTLKARAAGVVERVIHAVGDMVDAEVPLVDIKPDAADS